MKLRDLFVSIGFDVDDRKLKDLDRGLAKTRGLILAVGAAAVAGAGSLFLLAKNVADAGDKAAKTAGRMGIGVEMLQEYQYAAQLAGMQVGELSGNMEQFIRRSAEAARGSGEAKKAYDELRISMRDANGQVKSSDRLLGEVADRFAQIQDGSAKVRLAYALFGRSGVGMVNLLNQGSAAIAEQRAEARRLGIVLSDEAARAAELFQDELLRARSVVRGIKNDVGAGLIPVLTELFVQFRQWALANREIIRSGIERFLRGMIALLRWLYGAGSEMVRVLVDIVQMFGGIERVAMTAAVAIGIFAGAQVLMAIGNLAIGLKGVVMALKAVRVAALLANASVIAIPLLIGAAIAAVVLIIQDIISFFQGKDSVTGIIVEAFKKYVPDAIAFAVQKMKEWIGLAVDWVKDKWSAMVDWMVEKLQLLLRPLVAVRDWLLGIDAKIRNAGAGIEGGIEKARQWLWGGGPGEIVHNVIGAGPQSAPAASGSQVVNSSNVNVNAPVTVTVPEGTPPEQVGQSVRQGVADGIARMLRDAARATEPQVVH